MNRRKALFSGAAVIVMASLVTACGNSTKNSPSNSSTGTQSSNVTINLLMPSDDADLELRDKLIPQFEQETGIHVNVSILPESGMEQKQILSLAGNTGEFDVMMVGQTNWSQLTTSGWLKELSGQFDSSSSDYKNGFTPQVKDLTTVQGKLYAVPYTIGSDVLFYNKSMFKAAGLDPNHGPTTLDQLLADAKKLNDPSKGQYGFVARGTTDQNSFIWLMMWLVNGGSWTGVPGYKDYEVLDAPAALKTTEYYAKLMKYTPPGIASYTYQDAQLAMEQGKAAMWLDGASLGPDLENPSKSKIAGNVGYSVIQGTGAYSAGAFWAFAETNTTKHPAEDWKLIQFLTSKQTMVYQLKSGTNGSPARADALEDPSLKSVLNPDFAKALIVGINHANPDYTPMIPQGPQIRNILGVALSNVINGQTAPDQAMKDANNKVTSILNTAN